MLDNTLSLHGNRKPEQRSERNQQLICMVRQYKDLETLLEFDTEFVLGIETNFIRVRTVRPTLLDENVEA